MGSRVCWKARNADLPRSAREIEGNLRVARCENGTGRAYPAPALWAPGQVEWVEGDLRWSPPLRLGGLVLAAEGFLRKTRCRCLECSKRKRSARNPASRSREQERT